MIRWCKEQIFAFLLRKAIQPHYPQGVTPMEMVRVRYTSVHPGRFKRSELLGGLDPTEIGINSLAELDVTVQMAAVFEKYGVGHIIGPPLNDPREKDMLIHAGPLSGNPAGMFVPS